MFDDILNAYVNTRDKDNLNTWETTKQKKKTVNTKIDKKSEECRVKNEVIEVTDLKIPSNPRQKNEPNQDFRFYLTIAN